MFEQVTSSFLSERAMGTQRSYKLRLERWCQFLGCRFGGEESEYFILQAKPPDARRFMEIEQQRPGRDGRTGQKGRATAITKLLSDGEDYRSVQEFSRHASVQMVELYDKRFLGVEKSPGNRLTY